MNIEPVIGLEIHFQLKTKSKMFCSCANIFGDVKPNSAICPICLGHPGALPVPNKKAIKWTQKLGAALSCELSELSKFDRKSYFYPDLPKGYQISQFDQPFCGMGHLDIVVNEETRSVGITRIHLEEDAAKNIHSKEAGYTLVDYNRAGTPLAELVTEPDIKSPADAKVFLQELQRIVRALDISDADMEKGQMRCDVNISMREKGSKELHPKTEIKNVNSFKFVERALFYEIKRQTKEWETGNIPNVQATRGFDSSSGKTYEQRIKENVADYRYFPEPDIPPFKFTPEELAANKAGIGELPNIRKTRLIKESGISEQQAQLLVNNTVLADYFESSISEIRELTQEVDDVKKAIKLTANIILRQLRDIIRTQKLGKNDLRISSSDFSELILLIVQGKVNMGSVEEILNEMQKTSGDPDHVIQNLGLEQVNNDDELDNIIKEVIETNPDVVAKIKGGKEEAVQFLMGQVMGKTQGRANPAIVIQKLKEQILG